MCMRVNPGQAFLIVAALLLGASSAAAQADSSGLVVTANILEKQYFCAAGSDVMTLQLRVHLRYTNTGSQKLILYKGEDLFYQAKIRPASVQEGARPYEIVVLNARYLEVENEALEQPAPGKLFTILQPGASYETETTLGVGVVGQGAPRARHAIFEGEHTLQLVVVTWYRSRVLAEKLSERWQRKGALWYTPVVTNEMRFRAERPQPSQPCK